MSFQSWSTIFDAGPTLLFAGFCWRDANYCLSDCITYHGCCPLAPPPITHVTGIIAFFVIIMLIYRSHSIAINEQSVWQCKC